MANCGIHDVYARLSNIVDPRPRKLLIRKTGATGLRTAVDESGAATLQGAYSTLQNGELPAGLAT